MVGPLAGLAETEDAGLTRTWAAAAAARALLGMKTPVPRGRAAVFGFQLLPAQEGAHPLLPASPLRARGAWRVGRRGFTHVV
jgi:hypothetical protein